MALGTAKVGLLLLLFSVLVVAEAFVTTPRFSTTPEAANTRGGGCASRSGGASSTRRADVSMAAGQPVPGKSMLRSRAVGIGSSAPDTVLPNSDLEELVETSDEWIANSDLEELVETSDEWIATRMGIRKRHLLKEGEGVADLAISASTKALVLAGVDGADIDLVLECNKPREKSVVMATSSPDDMFGDACVVANSVGAKSAVAFDLTAACSGFLFAGDQGWIKQVAITLILLFFLGVVAWMVVSYEPWSSSRAWEKEFRMLEQQRHDVKSGRIHHEAAWKEFLSNEWGRTGEGSFFCSSSGVMVTVAVGMLTILAAIIWHKDDGHGIHEIIGVTIVGAAIPGGILLAFLSCVLPDCEIMGSVTNSCSHHKYHTLDEGNAMGDAGVGVVTKVAWPIMALMQEWVPPLRLCDAKETAALPAGSDIARRSREFPSSRWESSGSFESAGHASQAWQKQGFKEMLVPPAFRFSFYRKNTSEGSSCYGIGRLFSFCECCTAKKESSCPGRMSFANQHLADQQGVGARGVVLCRGPAASGYDCHEPRGGRWVPERWSDLTAKRSSLGCLALASGSCAKIHRSDDSTILRRVSRSNLSKAHLVIMGGFALSRLGVVAAKDPLRTGAGGVADSVTNQLVDEECYPVVGLYGSGALLMGLFIGCRVASWLWSLYGDIIVQRILRRFGCHQGGTQAVVRNNDIEQGDDWVVEEEIRTVTRRRRRAAGNGRHGE